MALTRLSLEKFKRLYLQEFGEELSDKEVKRKAEYLVNIYRAMYNNVEFPDSDKNKGQEK